MALVWYSNPFLFDDFQIADIREFEEFADTLSDMEQYPLYQSAIRHREEAEIPYRMLRTELVNCGSDLEYLAKLHCIRLAFQYLFKVSDKIFVHKKVNKFEILCPFLID